MPVTYQLDPASGVIETRCMGAVTFDEVMEHFRSLEDDPSLPRRLDVLLDLDKATSAPATGQLRDVAAALARLRDKVEFRACAIVASSDLLFGMSRMFEVFAEGLFKRTRVVRAREDAERWLALARATEG